jgi:hypothetical protein
MLGSYLLGLAVTADGSSAFVADYCNNALRCIDFHGSNGSNGSTTNGSTTNGSTPRAAEAATDGAGEGEGEGEGDVVMALTEDALAEYYMRLEMAVAEGEGREGASRSYWCLVLLLVLLLVHSY